ncbi:MAG: 4Fe-4S dicluster domain-containing protein, partial [Pseudomonadota bacterium]
VPGLVFAAPAYRTILYLAQLFSPLLGLVAKILEHDSAYSWSVPLPEADDGSLLLKETSLRCTFCGACISSCPAYFLTHSEMTTGRAKLKTAEALLSGKDIDPHEISSIFKCLHCGLCQNVCQTRLPLLDCYVVLEKWLEKRFGKPTEGIQSFVRLLELNVDQIKCIFGLDRAQWSSPDVISNLRTIALKSEAQNTTIENEAAHG